MSPFRNLLLATAVLLALVWGSSRITAKPIARGDFFAYWSAAYLLSAGQNFHDETLLLETERAFTGWDEPFVVRVWNPPWLLALMLPLSFLPFAQAAWFWLLFNILLFFVGSVLLWTTLAETAVMRRFGWVAALITFFFSPTLLALIMGQVSPLVFFGLALFYYFYKRDELLWAGAALALTLVKPHLVYLTLPLLLWLTWQRGQLRLWWGTVLVLVGLTAVTFFFRPTFLLEYGMGVGNGRLLDYSPPTLGGIIHFVWGWQWAKFLGLGLLPLLLWLFHRQGSQVADANLISLTLLLSIVSAPFGWSYDQIVLLFPLLQLILWIFEGRIRSRLVAALLLLALIGLNLLSYALRLQSVHEVYYFWLPLSLLLLYSWGILAKNEAAGD